MVLRCQPHWLYSLTHVHECFLANSRGRTPHYRYAVNAWELSDCFLAPCQKNLLLLLGDLLKSTDAKCR